MILLPIPKEEFQKLKPIKRIQGKNANELELKVSIILDDNNIEYGFKKKIVASRVWEVDFLINSPPAVTECKYSKSNYANVKIQSGEAFMLLTDIKYNSYDEKINKNYTKYIFIYEALPPKGKELGSFANPFKAFQIEVCEGRDWDEKLLRILKLSRKPY